MCCKKPSPSPCSPVFPIEDPVVRTLPFTLTTCAVVLGFLGGCSSGPTPTETETPFDIETGLFLDTVQARTFDFFWETTNPDTGLTPEGGGGVCVESHTGWFLRDML